MKVYFVGAGPGDPDLLTIKAVKMIRDCQCCVYTGSLISKEIISLIPDHADKYDSGSMTLEEIVAVFKEAKTKGMDVVRLHTGDPSIYGAIAEQMVELDQLQVDYEIIPGVSSFQAAAAALKTELTAPEIAQAVILTRTAGRTPLPKEQELAQLAKSKTTLCIFLSVHKIGEVADTLIDTYGEECPAAVVYRASWPDQRVIRGTLKNIALHTEAANIHRTALVVIGEALSPKKTVSKLYNKDFSHGYREAKGQ